MQEQFRTYLSTELETLLTNPLIRTYNRAWSIVPTILLEVGTSRTYMTTAQVFQHHRYLDTPLWENRITNRSLLRCHFPLEIRHRHRIQVRRRLRPKPLALHLDALRSTQKTLLRLAFGRWKTMW